MGLDVVDVGGVHGGVCVGAAQHVTLAFDGGRDQVATALAVVADGGSADDRPDAVAVGESGRQRLEDDGSNAVAADEAVARGVGELAAAVGGEHAGARVDDALFRQEYEIDPAGDRQGHSPSRIAWTALWTATSAEEQAVSTVKLGPRRSNA